MLMEARAEIADAYLRVAPAFALPMSGPGRWYSPSHKSLRACQLKRRVTAISEHRERLQEFSRSGSSGQLLRYLRGSYPVARDLGGVRQRVVRVDVVRSR